MKKIKLLAASAMLALVVAVPAAHAQNQPAPKGVADCGVKLVTCIVSGGNVATCLLEFAACLASGGASHAVAARRD